MHACMVLHRVGRDHRPFKQLLRTAGRWWGATGAASRRDGDRPWNRSPLQLLRGVPEQLRPAARAGRSGVRVGSRCLSADRPGLAGMRWLGESHVVFQSPARTALRISPADEE
jgi:hypothetical protein